MLHPMQLQHMIIAEIPETDIAMIRFLAGMRARMHFQLLGTGETLATALHRTFIGFLAGMRAHVNHQLSRLYEGLLAHRALMRTLAGMNAHVTM